MAGRWIYKDEATTDRLEKIAQKILDDLESEHLTYGEFVALVSKLKDAGYDQAKL